MKTVKRIKTVVDGNISLMYEDRYLEIEESGLLPAAEVLAEAFLKESQIKLARTKEIVKACLAENPLADPVQYAMKIFNHTRYIVRYWTVNAAIFIIMKRDFPVL